MPDKHRETVRVIDSKFGGQPLPIVVGSGSAHAVLWPGNGAHYRSFHLVDLHPGDRTRDLSHASECIYYVERGSGTIRGLDDGMVHDLVEGAMIHVGIGDSYRIEAGPQGMRLLGGTVPVDPAFYELSQPEVAR
jgi:quercetin dioxygenase-like cupin family protein